jgi:hypothetical protein
MIVVVFSLSLVKLGGQEKDTAKPPAVDSGRVRCTMPHSSPRMADAYDRVVFAAPEQ